MSDPPESTNSMHVHDPRCTRPADSIVFRCRECESLFECGIADRGPGGGERCPQCGLENAVEVETPGEEVFVIRHTSRFR